LKETMDPRRDTTADELARTFAETHDRKSEKKFINWATSLRKWRSWKSSEAPGFGLAPHPFSQSHFKEA